MNTRVTLTIEQQIAYVTLNRAEKHNALDYPMFIAIRNTIKQLKANTHIRVVIVQGAGDDFCSGLDVKSVMKSPLTALKLLFKLNPFGANLAQYVSTGWRDVPCPVIAVIQGRCWGGGLQIALGADFRVAKPNAELSIMEARWGLIPDMGGTLAFKALLPLDQAKWLAMTAEQISAEKALNLGLVTHVSTEPLATAQQMAQQLIQGSPDAQAAVKKLYNLSWFSSAGKALWRESWYQIKVLLGKNQKIAVQRQQQLTKQQTLSSYKARQFR